MRIKLQSIYDLPLYYYDWTSDIGNYAYIFQILNVSSQSDTGDLSMAMALLDEINSFRSEGSRDLFDGTVRSLEYLRISKQIDYQKVESHKVFKILLQIRERLVKQLVNDSRFEDPFSYESRLLRSVITNLYLKNDKLFITKNCANLIDAFETLTYEEMRENPHNRKAYIIDLTWCTLFSTMKCNEDNEHIMHISDYMQAQIDKIEDPSSSIAVVFKILTPLINQVVKKYFSDEEVPLFQNSINEICAYTFFRFIDYAPLNVTNIYGESLALTTRMLLLQDIERPANKVIIGFSAADPKNLVGYFYRDGKIDQWFVDYFRNHITFKFQLLKMQFQQTGGKNTEYIPIHEGFRFISNSKVQAMSAFHNFIQSDAVRWDLKDVLVRKVIREFQLSVMQQKSQQAVPKATKEALFVVLHNTFTPLQTSLRLRQKKYSKVIDQSELAQLVATEFLYLVLEFETNSESKIFGYLKDMLAKRVWTSVRKLINEANKKVDDYDIELHPKDDETDSVINDGEQARKLKQALEDAISNLPKKQAEAISKRLNPKEPLSATERKNLQRAKERIKQDFPQLQNFI